MAVVIASDLAKDMAGEPLLRGVSFKLERRDRLTLSGRNGSGKTTLLRMLSGETGDRRRRAGLRKGRADLAARPAPAARPRPDAARLRALGLQGAARARGASSRGWRAGWPRARSTTRRWTPTPAAQTRLEHAGRLQLARGGQRDAARARVPRRAPGPLAVDLLRRRADARVAGACAGRRSRPAAARRAHQPPRHRRRSSGSRRTCRRSTPRSSWSRTIAGSSRPSAPRCSSSRAGARSYFKGTWHAWRLEKAQRELALGRAIEKQEAEVAKLERFVTRFRAGTRARQATVAARRSSTRSTGSDATRRISEALGLRLQAAGALRPGRVRGRGRAAEDRRPRPAARTPSCGSSAASTCRWSAPTAPARRR